MINISHLRNDLDGLKNAISRKKFECDLDELVEFDQKRRDAISAAEKARAGQKATNNEMAQLPKGSPEFLAKVAEMKDLAAKVKGAGSIAKEADDKFKDALMTVQIFLMHPFQMARGKKTIKLYPPGEMSKENSPILFLIMTYLGLMK